MAYGETFKVHDTTDGFDLFYSSNNNLMMIEDSDKITQDISILFKTQVGEDMFNSSFGTNISVIINANTPEMVIETVIKEAAMKYRYFKKIKYVKILEKDYVNRFMRVEIGMIFNNEVVVFTLVI